MEYTCSGTESTGFHRFAMISFSENLLLCCVGSDIKGQVRGEVGPAVRELHVLYVLIK